MKSIMISIRPEFVEKILNKEKTIEIRKTMPKCELPCKVYIYCTMPKKQEIRKPHSWKTIWLKSVVAEFTLNKITKHEKNFIDFNDDICYNFKVCDVKNAGFDTDALSLVDFDAFVETYGNDKPLYAWHIDNLKIYDKPKELSEFYSEKECPYKDWGDVDNIGCWEYCCEMFSRGECRFGHLKLERPPQSWFYVEEMMKSE